VGLIQSNFIPWKGYFDFIDDVDLFIYHDDLQYTKGDWRNRNKIKIEHGTAWITVPVCYKKTAQLICDTHIDYSQNWVHKMINKIDNYYHKAPYYKSFAEEFFAILNDRHKTISELNVTINNWIMRILGIKTKIKMSDELIPQGSKTDRIMDILVKAGATIYLSGLTAKDYLEESKFAEHGIALEYKSYQYREYPQLYGKFEPKVTILDMLFNVGVSSKEYWKSTKPNEKVLQ
jgi:hypothetical protein